MFSDISKYILDYYNVLNEFRSLLCHLNSKKSNFRITQFYGYMYPNALFINSGVFLQNCTKWLVFVLDEMHLKKCCMLWLNHYIYLWKFKSAFLVEGWILSKEITIFRPVIMLWFLIELHLKPNKMEFQKLISHCATLKTLCFYCPTSKFSLH